MRLTGLSYKTANWELKEIEFEEVSLIVGKNATGKTKTLEAIHLLYEIICQKREVYPIGEWVITLTDGAGIYLYTFSFGLKKDKSLKISSEEMTFNGEVLFTRINGHGNGHGYVEIHNFLSKMVEFINPPSNKLVIHALRDTKKYPYIEAIVKWAEQSFGFKFGNVYSKYKFGNEGYGLLSGTDHVSVLLNTFKEKGKKNIINELKDIGFPVEKLDVLSVSGTHIIILGEKGIKNKIIQDGISQGMFRSLSVLIFIEYLISKKSTATIIIDDLCEGLDYERATKLGRLLFDKCLANNIQLIATSNDMFLMDVVDLKYWNVLQRNGQVVTAINAKNHPALFDDFKFTGLSNFDFFASDYIAQNL